MLFFVYRQTYGKFACNAQLEITSLLRRYIYLLHSSSLAFVLFLTLYFNAFREVSFCVHSNST